VTHGALELRPAAIVPLDGGDRFGVGSPSKCLCDVGCGAPGRRGRTLGGGHLARRVSRRSAACILGRIRYRLYLLVLVASWTIAQSAPSPLRADNLPTQKLASRSYHWLYDEAFAKYYATGPSGGYYGPMPGGGYIGSGLSDEGSSMGYDPSAMMMGSGAPMAQGQGMGGNLGGVPPLPGPPPGPKESDFVNVAHAQWTLLFAAIGGCLAYWLYVTGPGRTEQQASGSS
jgi:hypothetical protein